MIRRNFWPPYQLKYQSDYPTRRAYDLGKVIPLLNRAKVFQMLEQHGIMKIHVHVKKFFSSSLFICSYIFVYYDARSKKCAIGKGRFFFPKKLSKLTWTPPTPTMKSSWTIKRAAKRFIRIVPARLLKSENRL